MPSSSVSRRSTLLSLILLSPLVLDPSAFLDLPSFSSARSSITNSDSRRWDRIHHVHADVGDLGSKRSRRRSARSAVLVEAGVTVYTGAMTTTSGAPGSQYTGLLVKRRSYHECPPNSWNLTLTATSQPAYDPLTLIPPPAPQPPVTAVTISVPPTADALVATGAELSIKQRGNFLGFSIELSVANTIIGSSATNLKVPFLNYLANIRTRAGQGAIVRVGGNSQEGSTLFLEGMTNIMIDKIKLPGAEVTWTPLVNYSPNLFYAMANISSLVDTEWYFGLAFNQSDVENQSPNIPLVAEYAQQILGDHLLGLQMGNEPDLYGAHALRSNPNYSPTDFMNEFDMIKQQIKSQAKLKTPNSFLLGPSTCCEIDGFELHDVLDVGWLTNNLDDLAKVCVLHYPNNNCQVNGKVINPQDIFADYLKHTMPQSLTWPYMDPTRTVLAAGKEIIMLETNTASCGGFPGLSDSFGAALWMTDYALQMAYRNFTAALLHVGGQNVYYNPFTPPPSNMSSRQWTTGAVYYSTLVVAETFGQSNVSQIVDLNVDSGVSTGIYRPGYAVYENGAPTRLALFNYVDDPTGASTYQATINLNGTALPSSTISVRYFQAASVAEKDNLTWAGQTLGRSFTSDGRLYGEATTVTIQCDMAAQTCTVPVYAPSMALVFLTPQALTDSTPAQGVTQTYATSLIGEGSATVDPAILATSNGEQGQGGVGGTSSGSSSGASPRIDDRVLPAIAAGLALLAGLAVAAR